MRAHTTRRTPRRLIALAMVAGLAAAACGDGTGGTTESAGEISSSTTAPSTTVAPTTTLVMWAGADDILDNAPDQVLPALPALINLIDDANLDLGATDSIRYDEEDQAWRVAIDEGPCTQIAFATFFYDANVAITDVPSVGLLAPGLTASVCDDETAAAERADFWFGLVDLDQGACPVDDRDASGFGVLVCPRQPGAELKSWSGAAVGMIDRVLFWVNADLGPETDPIGGGEAIRSVLDALIAHVEDRLA